MLFDIYLRILKMTPNNNMASIGFGLIKYPNGDPKSNIGNLLLITLCHNNPAAFFL